MPLYEMVGEKKFRQDLIYRINTVEITLPPLRERLDDIPPLVNHYLEIYSEKYRRELPELQLSFLQQLKQYHWPGNIRELQHALERAVIMEDLEAMIPEEITHTPSDASIPSEKDFNLEEVEKNRY